MTPRQRLWLFGVAIAGFAAFYLWGLAGLPGFGHYPGPYGDVINRIDRDLSDGHGLIPKGHKRFARESKKVLELSLREAFRLRDSFIGTEHVLLGLLRQGDSTALETLKAFDIGVDDVRRAVEQADRRAG